MEYDNNIYQIEKQLYKSHLSQVFLLNCNNQCYVLKINISGKDKIHQYEKYILDILDIYPFHVIQLNEDEFKKGILKPEINGKIQCALMPYLGTPIKKHSNQPIFTLALNELNKIHEKNIIHFDIKPDNLLYSEKNNKLTIIDFGFSRLINGSCSRRPPGGTTHFMSPYLQYSFIFKQFRKPRPKKIDDYISLYYTFLEFYEIEYPWKYLDTITENIMDLDSSIVKKYGSRHSRLKKLKKKQNLNFEERLWIIMADLEHKFHLSEESISNDKHLVKECIAFLLKLEHSEDIIHQHNLPCNFCKFYHDKIGNCLNKNNMNRYFDKILIK